MGKRAGALKSGRIAPGSVLRRLNQRGEGNTGCIFIALILGVGVFVAYKFAIPFYQYNNLESRISEMVPYYRHQEAPYIKQAVIDIGKEFSIPLDDDAVEVQVLKRENRIIIDVEYDKDVVLPFYTHTLTFTSHMTGAAY